MKKRNCWEFKKCGREPGGANAEDLGVCPVPVALMLDGVHGGTAAGRACWVIAGTMCEGRIQGTFAQKYRDCGSCDFYKAVREEEGSELTLTIRLLDLIQK
jgi:hypothetical protein